MSLASNPLFVPSKGYGATYVPQKDTLSMTASSMRKNQPTGEEIAKGRYGSVRKYGYINPAISGEVKPVSPTTFEKSEGMGGAKNSKSKKTTKQPKKPAAKHATQSKSKPKAKK